MLLQLNKTGAASTPPAVVPTTAAQVNQLVMPNMPGMVNPNMLGVMPGMTGMPEMPAAGANVAALANYEAVKRAHELALRLGFHQIPYGMPTMPTMLPTMGDDGGAKSVKAPVLRLDAHGREVDEHGHLVERSKATSVSTLKVQFHPNHCLCVSRIQRLLCVRLRESVGSLTS